MAGQSNAGRWRARARRGWLAGCLMGALAAQAQTAEPPVITWTPEQAQAAGVRTLKLVPSATGPGAGLTLQGTVTLPPQATAVVSVPVAGTVQEVLVGPGEPVKAGTPLVRVLSPELVQWQGEWQQAQTQAGLAASKQRRDEKLFAEGIIPEARLQESRSQARVAQLAATEQKRRLEVAGAATGAGLNPGLVLRAPVSGTVMEVPAAPGQRLEAGGVAARLLRPGRLSIELQATPEQAARLRVGDALQVAGCTVPARLAAIAPQVNAGNQSVLIRADVTGGDACLRVHQFATVTVPGAAAGTAGAATQLRVPATAVVQQAGKSYVFVRGAKGYVPTSVALGADGGAAGVEVKSGLKPGDEVVVQGTAALKGAWQGLGAPEK